MLHSVNQRNDVARALIAPVSSSLAPCRTVHVIQESHNMHCQPCCNEAAAVASTEQTETLNGRPFASGYEREASFCTVGEDHGARRV